jgi:hypothetical protein
MIKHQERLLEALNKDKAGDWDGAHRIVQNIDTLESNSIHAYLHRKEGDYGNARYWYGRVDKPFPEIPLQEEWQALFEMVNAG